MEIGSSQALSVSFHSGGAVNDQALGMVNLPTVKNMAP